MNPEFKRNLWLEISPSRLILMPAVLGLLALLRLATSETHGIQSLLQPSVLLFLAFTFAWGSFLVVASVNQEVSERTWDQQRLSALTPWQMAWGKLLGSTAYAWYGALLCALVAVLAAEDMVGLVHLCLLLLAAGVGALALHAWLMAGRLHTLDLRGDKRSGAGRLFGFLAVTMVLVPVFVFVVGSVVDSNLFGVGDDVPPAAGRWWGLGLYLPAQSLLLALCFLALGLLALWRSMGTQLMLRSTPWAWVLGVLALGLLLAGFLPETARHARLMLPLAVTALAATYCALFTEGNHRLVWQAVLFHRVHSSRRRLLQALPLWPLSWALAAVCVLAYVLTRESESAHGVPWGVFLVAALLRCLRDCGIYHFFALRRSGRSPLGMTLLTMMIMGLVLPGLIAAVANDWALLLAPWSEPMIGLVISNVAGGGVSVLGFNAWLAMSVHLVAVGGLVVWRWRSGAPVQSGLGAADPTP